MEERMTRNSTVPELPEERNEKELAALSYLWIFGPILLVAKRGSPFIQHHARRATVLFALSLVLWFVPWLQYGEFLVLALAVFGFIQAATGNENHTPIIAEVADGTFGKRDLKHYYMKAKDGTIKAIEPDYVPSPMELGKRAEAEKEVPEVPVIKVGAVEIEDQKISSVIHRLTEDENEMHRLESEVKKLEDEVESEKNNTSNKL
jgi:uncharacterized membrane protein